MSRLVLMAVLVLLVPFVLGQECVPSDGVGTPTLNELSSPWSVPSSPADADLRLRIPDVEGLYNRAQIEFDFKLDHFNSGAPFQPVFVLRNVGGGVCDFYLLAEPGKMILATCGEGDLAAWETASASWSSTDWNRVSITYDAATGEASATISGAGSGSVSAPAVNGIISSGQGLFAILAGGHVPDGVVALAGSQYQNLNVQLGSGGELCGGGGGHGGGESDLTLVDGLGYTPDENEDPATTEILNVPGVFFTQPWNTESGTGVRCGSSDPSCEAEHWVDVPTQAGQAYEKIVVGFDFKTHDLDPPGYYQYLATLRNSCSGERFWRTLLKQPGFSTPGMTVLDARAYKDHKTWMKGDQDWQPMTTYRYEITYDLLDEETYIQLYDSSGTLIHTVGGQLNEQEDNMVRIEDTMDGFQVVFGIWRSFPSGIVGQPHLWEFSNLVVEATPYGGGTIGGPGGSDLGTDEGRLAFLAAHMLDVYDDGYALDCGPAEEVLPFEPTDNPAPYYCTLRHDDGVVFGTFSDEGGDGTNPEGAILAGLADPLFALHVDTGDIDETSCDGIDTTLQEWQECPDAVRNMHTHAFVDLGSGTSFVMISDDNALEPGLIDNIVAWFKGLFGLGGDDDETVSSAIKVRRFHHGYFSMIEDREVVGTWTDDAATISYGGFVTNITGLGAEDEIRLATGKQVLMLDLEPDSQAGISRWRRLTSALRIEDVSGTPVSGGSCGDGIVGLDEECEPGMVTTTCAEIYPELGSNGTARCVPAGEPGECQIDSSGCFDQSQSSGCYDQWQAGPSPSACPGDPACESDDDGGGDHGGSDTVPEGILGCGNGEVDDGENCFNCPEDLDACPVAPECPSPWLDGLLEPVGAYMIQGRSNEQGGKELRVVQAPLPAGADASACWGPGGGADYFEYHGEPETIPYAEGATFQANDSVLYFRERTASCSWFDELLDPFCLLSGSDDHWDTLIALDMFDGIFQFRGMPESTRYLTHTVEVDSMEAAGVKCWDCTVEDCSDISVTLNLADIQACGDPADATTETSCADNVDNDGDGQTDCQDNDCAEQCEDQCTGPDGCCLWNEACGGAGTCCGDFLYCGPGNVCRVDIGGRLDKPLDRQEP